MSWGWAEHVGEVELWVQAGTEAEVFAEALRAMRELLGEGAGTADDAPERHEVRVKGADRAALLAGFLEELAFLAETEGFVPEALEELALCEGELRAQVRGARGAPPHLVKAVTYHRLAFARQGSGWRARAILDV